LGGHVFGEDLIDDAGGVQQRRHQAAPMISAVKTCSVALAGVSSLRRDWQNSA